MRKTTTPVPRHAAAMCLGDMPVLIAGGVGGKLKVNGQPVNSTPTLPLGASRPLAGPHSTTQTGQVFICFLNAHGIMQTPLAWRPADRWPRSWLNKNRGSP